MCSWFFPHFPFIWMHNRNNWENCSWCCYSELFTQHTQQYVTMCWRPLAHFAIIHAAICGVTCEKARLVIDPLTSAGKLVSTLREWWMEEIQEAELHQLFDVLVHILKVKLSPKSNLGFICECVWVKPSCKSIVTMKEAPLKFTVGTVNLKSASFVVIMLIYIHK